MCMNCVRVEGLQSAYGRKKILQGITFEAHAGECIGIVGRNGCGKSTLLNILAGIYKPAAGSLFFDEKPGTPENIRKFTAYVPQNSNLYEELSVWDNLLFWYPDKRSLQNALKEGILQSLGIEEFLHKRVSHLSGGMKKKVSIACAMAQNAPVLLLDEPGTALDMASKQELRAYLRKYKSQGGCIILATHEEADLELCDKIYSIRNGKMEQEARKRENRQEPEEGGNYGF